MKLRNTLILFIVFVLLGGYVYLVEVKQHKKKEAEKALSEKVFRFERDSVKAVELTNKYGHFVIKKIQGEWRITEPLYTEADETVVNSMLTSLKNAKKESEFTVQPAELSQYGLGKRAVFVKLHFTDGSADSLYLGDKTPVGAKVFCNKSDSLIFTVSQSTKNAFEKKLFDIRFKKLLSFKRGDVNKIVIKNHLGKFEFEKSGISDWTLLNINRPADSGKLNGILGKLEYNRAKAFVDEEGTQLKKYGLAKPRYEITLFLGPEKAQKRLLISRKIKGKYYAKDDSRKPIFEIDSALVKDIKKPMSGFRSIDFVKFNREEVNRLVIEYGDTLIACVKDTSGNWALDDSTHRELKTAKINTFFSNLDFATVSDFVKDGKFKPVRYGFDKPSLKISLYQGDDLLLEATFGKKKGDKYYATNNQYESVYLIPASKVKDLKLKLKDILKPAPEKKEEKTVT